MAQSHNKHFTMTECHCEEGFEYHNKPFEDQTQKFRLKDDDGEIMFVGFMRPYDDEKIFLPLDWYQDDYGCTSIEILKDNGEWEVV